MIEQQDVPAEYLTTVTAQLDTKVAEAEAARDAAVDISNISTSDDVVSTLVEGTGGAGPLTRAALSASYAAQMDGTGKTAAEINSWLAASSPFNAKRLTGTVSINAPLVLDNTDIHFDMSGSKISTNGDHAAITMTTGQAITLRNTKIVNSFAGARTTYDIDITNPTKPLLFNVEVNLPNTSTGKGGIRIKYDSLVAGNRFMPQLDKVWIRNGHLIIDGVTDGHMHDCWVWAPNTGARAAVEFLNAANGWIIEGCDIVPPVDAGIGYYLEGINHTRFVGGYIDGNDSGLLTGYGAKLVNCGRITFAAMGFWNVGRSGLVLETTSHVKVISCDFSKCNKQDSAYPDIDLIDSDYNTFLSNSHWAPDVRVNKGVIYREDAASAGNRVDYANFSPLGDYYARPVVVANAGTMGRNNRPESIFPRVAGAPDLIVPPAALFSLPATATAWPAANFAIFERFTISVGGTYRYAHIHVEAGSGNYQVALHRLSGTGLGDYTRVLDSGVVACTTGSKQIDFGSTYLEPGEYALSLWCDNTTATFHHGLSNAVQGSRAAAKVSALAAGVPASGVVTWNGDRYVAGLSLGLAV